MGCGKWFCFGLHRTNPSPTQFFALVCEYCPGASGLGWLLQPTELTRGFTLSERQNYHLFPSNVKAASCYSGAGLARVRSMAFPAKLRDEFAKCGEVCQSFAQAGHRYANSKYCRFLEIFFLGYPAQPLLLVTAIQFIFPH